MMVTAAVSVLTTLLAVLYGPAWKDRVDARRARQERSDQLLARYSEPLARASFDLQNRLYNICRQKFVTSQRIPDEYRRMSTLWLFGQFLAWVEIVRREIQVIDYGDVRRTTELQRHLFDVIDILSSSTITDETLRMFRAEQRAVGELMVIDRTNAGLLRSDSMGYAEFLHRMETDSSFARWFTPLLSGMEQLGQGGGAGDRATLTQRALIDLIDFFDPAHIRFPDINERSKVPIPLGTTDRKRLRPVSEIARFRYSTDPHTVIESWRKTHNLDLALNENEARVGLPSRPLQAAYDLMAVKAGPWLELHVVRRSQSISNQTIDESSNKVSALSVLQLKVVNELLRAFDRPNLVQDRKQGAVGRRSALT
ncbi:MAG: hypothetical protein ACRDRO_27780 [Pseudonocardiaceae bacterium]